MLTTAYVVYCLIALCFMLFWSKFYYYVSETTTGHVESNRIVAKIFILASVVWPLLIAVFAIGEVYKRANLPRNPRL